jgi:multidrug efflux pump subunit AcrA (membrane-fusion protein)
MHDVAKGISNVPVLSNARPRRRGRAVGIAIGLLAAILVFAFGIKFLQIRKMMSTPMVMPPTTVSSATVKEENWAPTLSAVGSISAVQGAVVSSELGGVVNQIAFENGGTAKKGDLLVQLDASAEEAQLKSAEADLELARADLQRSRELAGRKVISTAEIDAAESKFKQKEGSVDDCQENRTCAVRWATRNSSGERRANDQRRPTSRAADFTRPGVRRFRLAAAISWSINAGLGRTRDYGRPSRAGVQRKVDRD